MQQTRTGDAGELSFSRANDDATLLIRLSGCWELAHARPSTGEVERAVEVEPPPQRVAFDTEGLRGWDSAILTFLLKVTALCRERGISTDPEGLPAGVRRLLELAQAVPEKKGTRERAAEQPWVARVGELAIGAGQTVTEFLDFLGETALAFARLARGTARFRASDLFLVIQQCGAEALPIVTLISFLVGMIFAFVGAVQLEQFGASIYVANLVGIAMVREMGAMMTAIVMAGRTGAAFAAELGTMKVTQEIDALRTMGISPMDFLVLPRMIALCLMLPLLCIFSDFIGILGGAAVGLGMLDLQPLIYYTQTVEAVTVKDLAGGLLKASVYGVLIAVSGCMRGMQCGGSSSAVGDAATSAVVTGIVLIVSACGIFAVVFYILGI